MFHRRYSFNFQENEMQQAFPPPRAQIKEKLPFSAPLHKTVDRFGASPLLQLRSLITNNSWVKLTLCAYWYLFFPLPLGRSDISNCLSRQLGLQPTSAWRLRRWHTIRRYRGCNGPFHLHIPSAGQRVWVGTDVDEAEQNIMTGDKQQPVNVWTSFCHISILKESVFIWGVFPCFLFFFFFRGTSGSDRMEDF